jgi:nucleoid-associated protein YgaU
MQRALAAAFALSLAFAGSACDEQKDASARPAPEPQPAAEKAPPRDDAARAAARRAAAALAEAAALTPRGGPAASDETLAAQAGQDFDNSGGSGIVNADGSDAVRTAGGSGRGRVRPASYTGPSRLYPVSLRTSSPPPPALGGAASFPRDSAADARGAGSVLAAFRTFEHKMYDAAAPILSRAGWHAAPRRGSAVAMTPTRVTVHHTDGNQTMSEAATMAEVRSIQQYHMEGHGWDDIGYHFLIDGQGRVVEGRPAQTMGAHVLGANENNIGIAMMGNFEKIQPTAAQLESLARLIAFLSIKYGKNPSTPGFVEPHRHFNDTDCPGANIVALLAPLRAMASGERTELLSRMQSGPPGRFVPVLATNA